VDTISLNDGGLFVLNGKMSSDIEKLVRTLTTHNFIVNGHYCTQTASILLDECEIRFTSDEIGVYVNVIEPVKMKLEYYWHSYEQLKKDFMCWGNEQFVPTVMIDGVVREYTSVTNEKLSNVDDAIYIGKRLVRDC
jgi:hypothetical protein